MTWKDYSRRFLPALISNFKSSASQNALSEQSALQQAKQLLQFVLTDDFSSNGFKLTIRNSTMKNAGRGVFLSEGSLSKGTVFAFYPGAVYYPFEPIFFQSIRNPYVFRCIDGVFIDGNHAGLSRYIYRSCAFRNSHIPFCDLSWLEIAQSNAWSFNDCKDSKKYNRFAIGQVVNNSEDANAAYQEVDLNRDDPLSAFLPNVQYSSVPEKTIRTVILFATRDINEGEELFTTYFTTIESCRQYINLRKHREMVMDLKLMSNRPVLRSLAKNIGLIHQSCVC